MPEKGWKILNGINSMVMDKPCWGCVKYHLIQRGRKNGKWTYPLDSCGPLTVFRLREDAVELYRDWTRCGSVEDNCALWITPCEYELDLENFVYTKILPPMHKDDLGKGTVLAKRIRLLS